jgi:hypothetical protein
LTTTTLIKLHQQHSRSKYASNILQVRNPISPKLLKPQTLNTIWHEPLYWSYCLAFKHGDSFLDMTLGEVYWYNWSCWKPTRVTWIGGALEWPPPSIHEARMKHRKEHLESAYCKLMHFTYHQCIHCRTWWEGVVHMKGLRNTSPHKHMHITNSTHQSIIRTVAPVVAALPCNWPRDTESAPGEKSVDGVPPAPSMRIIAQFLS